MLLVGDTFAKAPDAATIACHRYDWSRISCCSMPLLLFPGLDRGVRAFTVDDQNPALPITRNIP